MTQSKGKWAPVVLVLAMLAVLLSLSGTALASTPATSGPTTGTTGQTTGSRPQVWVVHVYYRSAAERDQLAVELGAEEAATSDGYLTVIADQATYQHILTLGLKTEIDRRETDFMNNQTPIAPNSPNTFYGGFRTVEEMQAFMSQYATTYPTLASVVDYGDSYCKAHSGCTFPTLTWPGYDLEALHITNTAIAGPKPVYWYEAGIHSREIATPEVAADYIQWLLDNYNSDPEAHWLVDYTDIYVIPMTNPDGHHIVEAGGGGSSPYYQRKNADNTLNCGTWPPNESSQPGVDNNRNFPFLWNCCGGSSASACSQTYHGASGGSDPETTAVVNKIRTLVADQRGPNITDAAPITATGLFQDMHSNASLDLYPWGMYTAAAPNGPELANLGAHMAAANAYPAGNSYQSCQPSNCLYVVDGDAFDWAYGELGMAGVSTEVSGNDFFVPISEVQNTIWPDNKGALMYQAKAARQPYLLVHGPDSKTVATSPMTVTQGTPSALSGTVNFTWTGQTFSQNVAAAEYYIDTPPWAGGTPVAMSGTFTSPTVNVSATIPTGALSVGRHIIFVRGKGATQFQGNDTWGPVTAAWLWVTPAQGTPTPTATGTPPTATSTVTAVPPTSTPLPPTATPAPGTATATATCVPAGGGWSVGGPFPTPAARAVGVYFPTNSKFYALGGRTSDVAGSEVVNPLEYNPATNLWTTKSAAWDNANTNNMAGGVLTISGTPVIVTVGGSPCCGGTTTSGEVRLYNPVADTLTVTTGDDWPPGAISSTIPGGFAVLSNKLYMIGGFVASAGPMSNQIWEYDPTRAVGSKWVQKVNLPVARGYVPAAAIGSFIYTAGGSDYNTTLVDTQDSFKFDPVANTIVAITNIPRATAETRALNYNGKLWVLGGGRTAPNPSNEVDIYDPGTDSWSLGPAFVTPRRNFTADTDGTHIWLAGGYDASGTGFLQDTEVYGPAGGCASPTPVPPTVTSTSVPATATATSAPATATTVPATSTPVAPSATSAPATSTAVSGTATPAPATETPGPSATPCTISFSDVHATDYFYTPVGYLACHGVISGYSDGTFRPFANTTRSQMVKIVVLGFGKAITTPAAGAYTFTDVTPANPFFALIETAAADNIVSGYTCGAAPAGPCDTLHRPYFLPYANVTRGQLSKIDVTAAGWAPLNPPTGSFEDVLPGSAFYTFVEAAVNHGVISGYTCGGVGEPCDGTNRPYFRQNNNAVRGQIAKIVYLSLTAPQLAAVAR